MSVLGKKISDTMSVLGKYHERFREKISDTMSVLGKV